MNLSSIKILIGKLSLTVQNIHGLHSKKVNDKILNATSSEDKMLGDYFVNPSDGVITEKVLLNKILFYLWNDVCKDGEGDIFKISETEEVSFSELYGENGTITLKKMMSYLGVTTPNGDKVTIEKTGRIQDSNLNKFYAAVY